MLQANKDGAFVTRRFSNDTLVICFWRKTTSLFSLEAFQFEYYTGSSRSTTDCDFVSVKLTRTVSGGFRVLNSRGTSRPSQLKMQNFNNWINQQLYNYPSFTTKVAGGPNFNTIYSMCRCTRLFELFYTRSMYVI